MIMVVNSCRHADRDISQSPWMYACPSEISPEKSHLRKLIICQQPFFCVDMPAEAIIPDFSQRGWFGQC